jgi:hypothetical protein
MVSFLQAGFFALNPPLTVLHASAGLAAFVAILGVWRVSAFTPRTHFWFLMVMFGGQFSIFAYHLSTPSSVYLRLWQVGIGATYFLTLTAFLLVALRQTTTDKAFFIACSCAVGFLVVETFASQLVFPKPPEWSGEVADHPELGMCYKPNSTIYTFYPDNPRGYFHQQDAKERMWHLQTTAGNSAKLEFSQEMPNAVLVPIAQITSKESWGVQLTLGKFPARKNQLYRLSFKSRANTAREAHVAFSMAHPPWNNLGLYQAFQATPDWNEHVFDFAGNLSDNNARIHFDIGVEAVSIEIADVRLGTLPDNTILTPILPPTKFSVAYRFNALGCRGPDYPPVPPEKTLRIVALGDSYTLGVGVHEKDTFSRRLEHILNQKTENNDPLTYEVINCGVSGYSTREERLFYERVASRYNPDIVLLTMVTNDDRSWMDDVKMGYFYSPGQFGQIFHTWAALQTLIHRRPDPDYSICLDETLKLYEVVKRNNARLAVVVFDCCSPSHHTYKDWKNLIHTMKNGLTEKPIPLTTLVKDLLKDHSSTDLVVHARDLHPNEIAHKIAAEKISRFLRREGMLKKQ